MLNRLTYLWNATFCGPFFKSYLGGGIDFTFYNIGTWAIKMGCLLLYLQRIVRKTFNVRIYS